MTHLDEGTLVSIRDGTLHDADARLHLNECLSCEIALREARERSAHIEDLLESLEQPADTEAAKAAVRARLDRARAKENRVELRWGHVGRAAAVLLVAAGAVTAMPGSPVRDLIFGGPADPGAATTATVQEAAIQGGIEVPVPNGSIEVVLHGVPQGTTVEVILTADPSARVEASAGSSFSFTEGRAEATIADGPVRVELPRTAAFVSLEIDGRTYLRGSGELPDLVEPAVSRSGSRITFVVEAR